MVTIKQEFHDLLGDNWSETIQYALYGLSGNPVAISILNRLESILRHRGDFVLVEKQKELSLSGTLKVDLDKKIAVLTELIVREPGWSEEEPLELGEPDDLRGIKILKILGK